MSGGPTGAPGAPAQARFHGRRHGRRLRPGRQRLIDELLPRLAVPAGDGPLDPPALFARPVEAVWLEVGFGAGEHLVWQAAQHPGIGLIGCEPFVNGVAALLARVEAGGDPISDRVRLWPDAAAALVARLPAGSIDRVFVLFPDPWPKRRHWNRRFIQPAMLDRLAEAMADGAELRLATDDPGLADWMLWQVRAHPAFAWTAAGAADWCRRPADWPPTRYEQKQLEGPPVFLRFRRNARSGL